MDLDTIKSKLSDPTSFLFQFVATFLTLFILIKLSCTIGCLTTLGGTGLILIFASWKITKLIRRTFFHDHLSPEGKAVLVTGCDSGFGNSLALRLNSHGFLVFAGCFDPNGSGPQSLVKDASYPKAMRVLAMDVTKEEDVIRCYEQIKTDLTKEKKILWAIVNNAGIAKMAHVEWGQLDDYQKVFDVNVIGLTRVTRTFLHLVRKAKGRVLNVSSMAGRVALPGMAIYAMSKHAVVAFSTALRREMIPWGVKVISIEPARYRTPMSDPSIYERDSKKTWAETSASVRNDYGEKWFESTLSFFQDHPHDRDPQEVVEVMVDAIRALEPEVTYRICSWKISLLWFLSDYLPYSLQDARYVKNAGNLKK